MEQQMQAGGVKEHEAKNKTTGKKHFWFTIVAKNHQVLATSEVYNSKKSMRKGIAALSTIYLG